MKNLKIHSVIPHSHVPQVNLRGSWYESSQSEASRSSVWHNRVLEVNLANNGGASKRNVGSNVTAALRC